MLDDSTYWHLTEALLQDIEKSCDQINEFTPCDIEYERQGSMLTLTFLNKSQIVINLQKPLQEVWLASSQNGYHYKWMDNQWLDTKTAVNFWQQLSRDASHQAGIPLDFPQLPK
ncbi:MAG: iron donor protein CyaY [Gammaproteobacteria bacterium]|nr:iron donor protein CyaY [Gammaproteobacteria bacterium]